MRVAGVWEGGPWGGLVLTQGRGDSLHGQTAAGGVVRGVVRGRRADIVVMEEGTPREGYAYVLPDGDSLFAGLRDRGGGWASFFSMRRAPPAKGRGS